MFRTILEIIAFINPPIVERLLKRYAPDSTDRLPFGPKVAMVVVGIGVIGVVVVALIAAAVH